MDVLELLGSFNIYLFIAFTFIFTYFLGNFLERFRIPWIFAALLLGSLLAVSNPFSEITSSDAFTFLAQLGMYFLLFIIGFEIDLAAMRKKGSFIVKSTFFIILLEGIIGTAFIHFVFGYDLLTSFIVALSFATVGEALLIPILHEFKMVNTTFGQTIIGIGTLDDAFEILTLLMAVVLIGADTNVHVNLFLVLGSLALMFLLTFIMGKMKDGSGKFVYKDLDVLFLIMICVLFLFLGIGEYADTTPLAALLAGIGLGNFLPKSRKKLVDTQVKAVCYGLFAPLFFLWVGSSLDIAYLVSFPLLVILVTLVANLSKILGSFIIARKELGVKKSIMLGVALSVRFSTSIIVIKLLYENGLIGTDLFSVIVASTIVFKFLVPPLLAYLLSRWK